jgi:hypothetical protein
MCVCVYIYIYVYIYIHTHTHTHTHTYIHTYIHIHIIYKYSHARTHAPTIQVIRLEFEWQGDWLSTLWQRPEPYPLFVGCSLTYQLETKETTQGVVYGVQV